MPTVRSAEVELYYETTGTGEPVLLVMGLGMNATGWWRTAPVLAGAGLRVLAFDNRGVGRSGRPAGPYTTAMMADDAVAVLDAAGVQRAHVYGISLGGMIAQEIALRRRDRVGRLVLGATTPGGSKAVPAPRETLEFFTRRAEMPAEEGVWASVPYNYAPDTRIHGGDRIAQDIQRRLRFPVQEEPYRAQLAAAFGHDTYDRLTKLAVPTLVVHGQQDVMVNPANGRLLADMIPGARLAEFPTAAHLYPTDESAADREVASFLTASA